MSKPVKVITKVPCPFCDRAISFLKAKGVSYEKVDLTDRPEEIDKIKNETGWKTVPIIFIDGKLIGGYMDMKDLDEAGELDRMLGL